MPLQIEQLRRQVKVIVDRADVGLQTIADQPRLSIVDKRTHELTQLTKMLELLAGANKAILALLDMAVAEEAAANGPLVPSTRPAAVALGLEVTPPDAAGIDSTPGEG